MSLTKVVLTGTKDKIKAAFERVNTMIDDLLATTSGKGASCIGIFDTVGNMDAANVEDALAEIYTDTSSSRTLGDTFSTDSATTTGLTWGYTAGSVRFDNAVTAVAAGTVSLTDNATNYIEVDSAGSVSRNTTAFTAGRIPIRQIVTLAGVQTTSTDKRSWFQSWDMPLPVAKGGSGAATLTDHGILLGSGTGAITPLGVATNGQIPIGSTGADPVLAAPTGTANQITVTLGAGTIALSVPNAFVPPGTVDPVGVVTVTNEGLHLLDTNASHDLIIKPGSDLSADRILTLTTGDAARTVALGGDLTTAGAASVSAFGATVIDDADAPAALVTLGLTALAAEINGVCDGCTATYAEINTACDGSTAKNSHTHITTPVAGTILIVNAPTTQSTDSGSYVKLKEARVLVTGAYKVSFTLGADAECVPYGRVYKNGAALSFTANDLVQIYALLNSGTGFTYVNNFTIGILALTDYADSIID